MMCTMEDRSLGGHARISRYNEYNLCNNGVDSDLADKGV